MDVVERAAGGDRSAQEAVLEGYYDFVRRMLFRLVGTMDEIDDLQQTVLMRVVTGLPKWRRDSALSTWIGGICVHVAKDHLRRRRARGIEIDGEVGQAAIEARPAAGDPHHTAEAREQLRHCRQALDRLSANHRMAFVLKTLGYSVDEIAGMTGSARSTTRLRLYYARKNFSRAIAAQPELQAAFAAGVEDA